MYKTALTINTIQNDRIFRVLQTFRVSEWVSPGLQGEDYWVWGCPVGPALQADFPEIEKVVQFMSPVSLFFSMAKTFSTG
jgi:putative ABC transport system permease protein